MPPPVEVQSAGRVQGACRLSFSQWPTAYMFNGKLEWSLCALGLLCGVVLRVLESLERDQSLICLPATVTEVVGLGVDDAEKEWSQTSEKNHILANSTRFETRGSQIVSCSCVALQSKCCSLCFFRLRRGTDPEPTRRLTSSPCCEAQSSVWLRWSL